MTNNYLKFLLNIINNCFYIKVAEVENEITKTFSDNQSQLNNNANSNEASASNSSKSSSNVLNISQHFGNFVEGITKNSKVLK